MTPFPLTLTRPTRLTAPAALTLALLLGASAPASALAPAPVSERSAEQRSAERQAVEPAREELYDLLDATRAEHGLPRLRRASAVQGVAQRWSQTMADVGQLAHNPRLRQQVPPGHRGWSENVGQTTAASDAAPAVLHQLWLDSPQHRRAVLDPASDTVGIGVVTDAAGRTWATTVFADR